MSVVILKEQPQALSWARSPMAYWVNLGDNSGPNIRFICEVFIWTGEAAAPPLDFEFQLVKYPNNFDEAIFEISGIVRSYLINRTPVDLTLDTNHSVNETLNVQVRLYWQDDNSISITPILSNVTLVKNGYYEYVDGINPDYPQTRIGSTRVDITDQYYYPVYIEEYDRIFVRGDVGGTKFFDFIPFSATDSVNRLIQIKAGPDQISAYGLTVDKAILIGGTPVGSGVEEPLFRLDIVCEPKYNPYQVMFLDRNGAWSAFTFFKRNDSSLMRTDKRYMNNALWPYPQQSLTAPERPEFYSYNTNGRYMLSLNSGIVTEEDVYILQELCLSNVFLIKPSGFSGDYQPAQLEKTNFELKQGINEGVFEYTFEFKLAYQAVTKSAI